ncbi:accessory gene regulator B family protein [Paenibacillus sepulcri]|uniref:Accessory gene regulator B family protein n=1 Tax=Paenibacillus sepulcri TaxID=359917 RepID=A0ABS7C7E6_9BACL|nr:accessory gene regulator B family protein [Paenibacillus sepulcri]
MLHKAAEQLHARIAASGNEPPSVPVISYVLHILVNTVSIILLASILGIVTGEPAKTSVVIVLLAVIRFLTGGYHLPTSLGCIAASSIVLAAIPHIHVASLWVYLITAAAFVMMVLFAPSNYDQHARIPERYYPLLKVLASAIVASNFFIGSDLLALTFATQSILLPIKGGEKNK